MIVGKIVLALLMLSEWASATIEDVETLIGATGDEATDSKKSKKIRCLEPLKRSKLRLLQSKLRLLRSVQIPMMAQLVVKKIPYLEKLLLSNLRQIRSVPHLVPKVIY